MVVKASQTELEMITTDRAELEALLLERKKTRKEGKAHKTEKNAEGGGGNITVKFARIYV